MEEGIQAQAGQWWSLERAGQKGRELPRGHQAHESEEAAESRLRHPRPEKPPPRPEKKEESASQRALGLRLGRGGGASHRQNKD